jgi:hypothetical protein
MKRENGVQEKAGGGACLGSSLKPLRNVARKKMSEAKRRQTQM